MVPTFSWLPALPERPPVTGLPGPGRTIWVIGPAAAPPGR